MKTTHHYRIQFLIKMSHGRRRNARMKFEAQEFARVREDKCEPDSYRETDRGFVAWVTDCTLFAAIDRAMQLAVACRDVVRIADRAEQMRVDLVALKSTVGNHGARISKLEREAPKRGRGSLLPIPKPAEEPQP